ncbi:MAG: HAD family hydrolase [archaeon]
MNKKILFLDMDGTLYPIEKGSFLKSKTHDQIKKRTIQYICEKLNFSQEKAEEIFDLLMKDYPKYYSVGLKELYGLERREYLDFVWDMNASKLINVEKETIELIRLLSEKYDIYLVSDAPKIWIENVSQYLGISNLLKGKFSGTDLNKKKKEGLFEDLISLVQKNPNEIFMVGDEEEVDIIPAKKLGINTIFIGKESSADYNIEKLSEIKNILLP